MDSAWLKRRHNLELAENHSGDLTVVEHLVNVLVIQGYSCDTKTVQGQDPTALDLLFVTRTICGQFLNVGSSEEVLQDDLKVISKPREQEGKVREVLFQVFGQWAHNRVSHNW